MWSDLLKPASWWNLKLVYWLCLFQFQRLVLFYFFVIVVFVLTVYIRVLCLGFGIYLFRVLDGRAWNRKVVTDLVSQVTIHSFVNVVFTKLKIFGLLWTFFKMGGTWKSQLWNTWTLILGYECFGEMEEGEYSRWAGRMEILIFLLTESLKDLETFKKQEAIWGHTCSY